MSNARIERMLRELNADPSAQFFKQLFGLIGLGDSTPSPGSSRKTAPTPA